jgi:hypothetical protein
MFALTPVQHCARELPVGEGTGAPLAHQIESQHILSQAKTFYDISAQAWTKVSRASRHDHGINGLGGQSGTP